MSSYILEIMCSNHSFPQLGRSWNISCNLVYVYSYMLWENKYKNNYYLICDYFTLLCRIIFNKECLRITFEANAILQSIRNWYIEEDYTYIIIFGVVVPRHIFPKYVLDTLFIFEIAYQSILHGVNATLKREKKKLLIPKLLYIGNFSINNFKIAKEKAQLMHESRFTQGQFIRHDTQGLGARHYYQSWLNLAICIWRVGKWKTIRKCGFMG